MTPNRALFVLPYDLGPLDRIPNVITNIPLLSNIRREQATSEYIGRDRRYANRVQEELAADISTSFQDTWLQENSPIVSVVVSDINQLEQIRMEIAAPHQGNSVSLLLTFEQYGAPVDIEPPPRE
jgi:hypothetical protein